MRLLHQAVATLQVAQALQDLTVLQAAAVNLQAALRQVVKTRQAVATVS